MLIAAFCGNKDTAGTFIFIDMVICRTGKFVINLVYLKPQAEVSAGRLYVSLAVLGISALFQ